MALKDFIQKGVISCEMGTPIFDVARTMDSENVGAVVVMGEGTPRGIVTDRDLVIRGLARKIDLETTIVDDVMTPAVECIDENESLSGALRTMKRGGVRRIVVLGEGGMATALLSFDDLFNLLAQQMNDLREIVMPLDSKIAEKSAA